MPGLTSGDAESSGEAGKVTSPWRERHHVRRRWGVICLILTGRYPLGAEPWEWLLEWGLRRRMHEVGLGRSRKRTRRRKRRRTRRRTTRRKGEKKENKEKEEKK